MRGLPQKQNARRAYKIRVCGHLRRYKKIVKKTYIILKYIKLIIAYTILIKIVIISKVNKYCFKDELNLLKFICIYKKID